MNSPALIRPPERLAGPPVLGVTERRPRSAGHRILIIDSEMSVALALRYNLELDGHSVESAKDASRGVLQARGLRPHLLILGQLLLDAEGYELVRELKLEHPKVPILILATRAEDATRIPGFTLGVDEYLLRPVSVFELHARVEMMLARVPATLGARSAAGSDAAVRFGDVEVHPASQWVTKGGKETALRPKEFDLLMALVRRNGRVVSRLELLHDVWGYTDAVVTRTVDTHVAELRRKLEDDARAPKHILTVRKRGYRLER